MNKQVKQKESQLKWIILDDESHKTKYFVDVIFECCPRDKVTWLHTGNIDHKKKKDFEFLENFKNFKNIEYKFLKTVLDFERYFDAEIEGELILLMDIHSPLFQNKVLPNEIPILLKKARSFMDFHANKLLVLSTGAAKPTNWANAISKDDDRIIRNTFKEIDFVNTVEEDCKNTVIHAIEEWIRKYEYAHKLDDFFSSLDRLNNEDCHNNFYKRRIRSEDLERLWHKKYDLPMQIGCLIDLLQYDKKKFLEDFKIIIDFGEEQRINESHLFFDCLKYFGPSDGNSISLLATIVIAWSAYNQIFRDGEGDEIFKKCIQEIEENPKQYNTALIVRASSIVPPQSNAVIRESAKSLFEMFLKLFKSKNWTDNLFSISISNKALVFELKNVDFIALADKLQREYKKRYFQKYRDLGRTSLYMKSGRNRRKGKQRGGGDTSRSILNFTEYATYCDEFLEGELICGSMYPFKIQSASQRIQLIFGYA